jgi:hypothetical protein
MMLTLLFVLLFSTPALAQDMPLENLSSHDTKIRINIGKFKNLKCKKRTNESFDSGFLYEFYLVDGHAQCSEPVTEKFCKVTYNMKASEYRNLTHDSFNLCRLDQNSFESGVHTLSFTHLYCPVIECHTSWLDLFSGFNMSNFRYNMGKYINFESDYD